MKGIVLMSGLLAFVVIAGGVSAQTTKSPPKEPTVCKQVAECDLVKKLQEHVAKLEQRVTDLENKPQPTPPPPPPPAPQVSLRLGCAVSASGQVKTVFPMLPGNANLWDCYHGAHALGAAMGFPDSKAKLVCLSPETMEIGDEYTVNQASELRPGCWKGVRDRLN